LNEADKEFRKLILSSILLFDHKSKDSFAELIAASISSIVPAGTETITSYVEGLIT
jgi:hypothetical protein